MTKIRVMPTRYLLQVRLDPGGRRVKDHIRADRTAAFITEESTYKTCIQTIEQRGIKVTGRWGSQWGSAQLFKASR